MKRRAVLFVGLLLGSAASSADDGRELWDAWPEQRFVRTAAPCLRPAELEGLLRDLAVRFPGRLRLEEAGRSVQGRPIYLMTVGRGQRKVLLWSQMHGDEPSATPALLDLVSHLLSRGDSPILDQLTLLLVPMLNPDGAEVYTRRNAQGIDINRDALNLATPEGRLLKRLRDEHQPILGFNLHDQNRRRTVGDTGVLATNAVLAVTGDAANTLTPGRLRAKRAAVAIATALEPFAPGGLGRYDEEWSPRAFGDNLTAWGTAVVLIESGGVAPGTSLTELTRLNFVALASALADLAADDLAGHDAAAYERIPENNVDVWTDVAVRGGVVRQSGSAEPYRADLAFDRLQSDRVVEGCPGAAGGRSEIVELGDARIFAAGREIDATGKILVPAHRVGIDGWRARRWLDGRGLDRLARLGVGQVVWVVAERDLDEALAHAEALRAPGRPGIEVTTNRRDLPSRVLRDLPAAALGLEPFDPLGRPPLRPDAPASFLLLRDLESAAIERIWLDGVEVD